MKKLVFGAKHVLDKNLCNVTAFNLLKILAPCFVTE